MKLSGTSIFFAIAVAILFVLYAAVGPSTLESRRLSDHCSALYGFNTDASLACMGTANDGFVVVASEAPAL